MKYILGIITTALVVLSFTNRKCDHVFTQVEQEVIKIERPDIYGSATLLPYHWPSGVQDGKDIICVKCFHVQKQKIDYGQPSAPCYGLTMPESWRSSTGTDSLRSLGIGTWSIKADTLQWSKVEAIK